MLFLMQTLTHLLVLALVVSTMLGVGLMLTVRDIYVSLHDRRWLVRALLANFVVLPAIALGVSRLLELDPVLAAALLVLATALVVRCWSSGQCWPKVIRHSLSVSW